MGVAARLEGKDVPSCCLSPVHLRHDDCTDSTLACKCKKPRMGQIRVHVQRSLGMHTRSPIWRIKQLRQQEHCEVFCPVHKSRVPAFKCTSLLRVCTDLARTDARFE